MTLNNDPEHGGITDADMEEFLRGTSFDPKVPDPTRPVEPQPPTQQEPPAPTEPPETPAQEQPAPTPAPTAEETAPAGAEQTGGEGSTAPSPPVPEYWDYEYVDPQTQQAQRFRLTKDEAYDLAVFSEFLRQNPEIAQQIQGVAQGIYGVVPKELSPQMPGHYPTQQPQPPAPQYPPQMQPPGQQPYPQQPQPGYPQQQPPQQPLQPPADVDLNDPTTAWLWGQLQATRQQLEATTQVLTRHESTLYEERSQAVQGNIETAVSNYQAKRGLNDDDMAKVRQVAANLGVLPTLLSGTDPVTGAPTSRNPIDALDRAFEIAEYSDPVLRERRIADDVKQAREDDARKAKLTSLGGATGSTPRQESTAPMNESQRREAMIQAVAQMQSGDWQGD